ncbi:hypothetical protein BN873_530011 [Candidatus Competibacter denitrificans Run_A_D11]|uniref:Uncharacterized protein n=1 Tax=Candidatus Competibacter denitrificans Run_A_D11 TaxID=1400863 RepID=W6M762_9GAMM|nr:hypothetical protein BN873_530011 [Candidatus Competibacter denitrificans Run_A_D11]
MYARVVPSINNDERSDALLSAYQQCADETRQTNPVGIPDLEASFSNPLLGKEVLWRHESHPGG